MKSILCYWYTGPQNISYLCDPEINKSMRWACFERKSGWTDTFHVSKPEKRDLKP